VLEQKQVSVLGFRREANSSSAAAAAAASEKEGAEKKARRLSEALLSVQKQLGDTTSKLEKSVESEEAVRERHSEQRALVGELRKSRNEEAAGRKAAEKKLSALQSEAAAAARDRAALLERGQERERELQRLRMRLSRATASLPSTNRRSGAVADGDSRLSELRRAVDATVGDVGAEAVAAELFDALPLSITAATGTAIRSVIQTAALKYASKAAVAGRTWVQLWLEFPELLTTLLESLTSGFGSGNQPFATRFAIASMAMCLSNPLCNLILQRPLSVLVASGMGGKVAVLKLLKQLTLSVSPSTAHNDRASHDAAGRDWVRLIVMMAVALCCVLVAVFDNIDWDMGRADQAIHRLLTIVCIGDPPVKGAPPSRERSSLAVSDLAEATEEEAVARRERALAMGGDERSSRGSRRSSCARPRTTAKPRGAGAAGGAPGRRSGNRRAPSTSRLPRRSGGTRRCRRRPWWCQRSASR
jgi:hypothetical protein